MRRLIFAMFIALGCIASVPWLRTRRNHHVRRARRWNGPGPGHVASTNYGGWNNCRNKDSARVSHGFMRSADGGFTMFDVPGAPSGLHCHQLSHWPQRRLPYHWYSCPASLAAGLHAVPRHAGS